MTEYSAYSNEIRANVFQQLESRFFAAAGAPQKSNTAARFSREGIPHSFVSFSWNSRGIPAMSILVRVSSGSVDQQFALASIDTLVDRCACWRRSRSLLAPRQLHCMQLVGPWQWYISWRNGNWSIFTFSLTEIEIKTNFYIVRC